MNQPVAFPFEPASGDPRSFPEQFYRIRRKRDAVFGDYFEDHSWDMMLFAYESRRRGRALTVSDICLGSNAPSTTALRHLAAMVERGWLVRVPHPNDRRASYVELTETGLALMQEWILDVVKIVNSWVITGS